MRLVAVFAAALACAAPLPAPAEAASRIKAEWSSVAENMKRLAAKTDAADADHSGIAAAADVPF
jgi:hypothetical protein